MNRKLKFTLSILALFVFLTACSDDDFPAPVISDFELGYNNNKTVVRGSDLHIDANIVAEGRIDRIVVEIHFEGDHKKTVEIDFFNTSWLGAGEGMNKFNGLKNTKFHEHIDVPADADLGEYHLHFKVIDKQGKVTDIEEEFEVIASTD